MSFIGKNHQNISRKHSPIISRGIISLLRGRGDVLESSSGEALGLGDSVVDAEKVAAGNGFEVLKLVVFAFPIVDGSVRTEIFDHLMKILKSRFLSQATHNVLTDAVFAEHVATTL